MPELELWKDDLLGRREDAEFIFRFLAGRLAENSEYGRGHGYVLNLDAGWGAGKSFFLEKFGEQLEAQGYLVARVNAWRDDFAADPFVSVLEAIEASVGQFAAKPNFRDRLSALKKEGAPLLMEAGKGFALAAARRLLADRTDAIADALANSVPGDSDDKALEDGAKGATEAVAAAIQKLTDRSIDQAIAEFRKAKASVDTFRQRLEALVEAIGQHGRSAPLFVFVDELDRCRPSFAIAMLERIKHLFQARGVVFIIATDTTQLEHSVRAVYGNEFDAALYLGRFFDRTYTFDEPALTSLVADLIERFPVDVTKISHVGKDDPGQPIRLQTTIASILTFFRINPRETSKCYDLLRTIVTLWDKEIPLELHVLLPLIVAQVRRGILEIDYAKLVKSALAGRPPGGGALFIGTRRGQKEYLEASAGFEVFMSMAQRALLETYIDETEIQGRFQHFARNQLQREFEYRQSEGRDIRSYLLSYPSLVRKAGRFTS